MNDDWRLRTELPDAGDARGLARALNEHERESGDNGSIHDRVIVSHDDNEVFCYVGTREQADEVRHTVETLAADHGWQATFELSRWHPTAERWEDPDTPLPTDDAQRAEEDRERVEQERIDSAQEGYPEFEVRIECPSRADAGELARQLDGEGIPYVHRSHVLLVGANDEESANELAMRLGAEAPPGSRVTVEGNLRAVYDGRPWWRPFWVLGGLGG